jgi:3-oxoacid CoA-transferase
MKTVLQLTVEEAAKLVPDGATIMTGGFGMTGYPVHLVHALAERDVKNLTIISNNIGEPGLGAGRLLRRGQIGKAIGSFFTSNPEAVQAVHDGKVAVELIPQGTMCEAIRAAGAGIGGFYTPTGVGTVLTRQHETRVINGVEHVFVSALQADVALLRAHRGDTAGNLVYRMTERNFNPLMATAADLVIAEVEEIVPTGTLSPNEIVTPGIFVDYLVQAHTDLDDLGSSASVTGRKKPVREARMNIARRAFAELQRGDIVNLGVGIPTLVADLISPEDGIILHTENGMLGVGPAPESGGALDYPVNAGKQPVTALAGASYFDSAVSFSMIRGGHVDVAIMGGLEVDAEANLANWAVPGRPLLGVGGAMDLASGAKKLIITMTHTSPEGQPKIVSKVTLPLTAKAAVDIIITELAVFKFIAGQLTLTELMPGATMEQVRSLTDAAFAEALRSP